MNKPVLERKLLRLDESGEIGEMLEPEQVKLGGDVFLLTQSFSNCKVYKLLMPLFVVNWIKIVRVER
jgi:hypothetical protein